MKEEIAATKYPEKIFNGAKSFSNQAELVEFGKNNFTRITGGLDISGIVFTGLSGLEPLRSINYIEEGLTVGFTEGLINLDGLSNLTFVGGALMLSCLDNVENLEGLSNLEFSDGLMIGALHKIKNLKGLEKLKTKQIYISDNPLLKDFCSLKNHIAEVKTFKCWDNLYNPTKQDIIDGKCK